MKTRAPRVSLLSFALILSLLGIVGCTAIDNIVTQLPGVRPDNYSMPKGQDISQANALLAAGKKREAAQAYFAAADNYRSPQRERLILQAAELAAVMQDRLLTQRYLAPLNYDRLNAENQARFRLSQGQLALNDRNYRETLRILPLNTQQLPFALGKKILKLRMNAAQASGDKIALVQELVLQEPSLTQAHEISLNHDRIWNQAQQIPAFQLNEAKDKITHPTVKSWLSLAQLGRIAKNGPASKKQSLRSDIGMWIQKNPNHPGTKKALDLLNAAPTTTVTPYPKAAAKPPVFREKAPQLIMNKPAANAGNKASATP